MLLSAFSSVEAGILDKAGTGSIKPRSAASSARSDTADNRPFDKLIDKYAKLNGVEPELAHAIIRVESNYNPKVRGSAGEIGLMQIKPATARMMGYSGGAKGLHDPETNLRYGMKYLAMAQELGGGETCGTVLRYNAGHAAKRMNPISKRYCGKVNLIMASN